MSSSRLSTASPTPTEGPKTKITIITDLVRNMQTLCLGILNRFRRSNNLEESYNTIEESSEALSQRHLSPNTMAGILAGYCLFRAFFPEQQQEETISSSAEDDSLDSTEDSTNESEEGLPTYNVNEDVRFGVSFLSIAAPDSIRERFETIFTNDLDAALANIILEYYTMDVWNCLSTSENYVITGNITMDHFRDHNVMLSAARLNPSTQTPKIVFAYMKPTTVQNFFNVIFPNREEDIRRLSNELVEGQLKLTLRFIDIRTAYILAMRNIMDRYGFDAVATFHQILFDQFRKTFRVMAYIGKDGKFVIKTGGHLQFGRFNISE